MLNRKVCAQCRRKSGYEFQPRVLADLPLRGCGWICPHIAGDDKECVTPLDDQPPEYCIHKLEHAVAEAAGVNNDVKS
jgi:hypothetical protein